MCSSAVFFVECPTGSQKCRIGAKAEQGARFRRQCMEAVGTSVRARSAEKHFSHSFSSQYQDRLSWHLRATASV